MPRRGRTRGSGWSLDNAKRAQLRRAGETDEERAKRLNDQRERDRNRRNNETEEERAERLRKQNIRSKAKRLQRCNLSADVGQMTNICSHRSSYVFHGSAMNDKVEETPEERKRRLARQRQQKRRARLSEQQLNQRRHFARVRHAAAKHTTSGELFSRSYNNKELMKRQHLSKNTQPLLINSMVHSCRKPEDVRCLFKPESESATTMWYLNQTSIDRIFEIPKCIQNIKDMCNEIDFRGFVATYTLSNIIKSSLFTEQTENRLLLHVCDCFLVNKQGKVGCGLYRVLMDVLGEAILVNLGLHTRSLHSILRDLIACGGVELRGEADTNLLLFIFTRFVLKL